MGSVIISNEVLRRCVPRKSFGDLVCKPLRRRVGCDTDPKDLPSADAKYKEREQAFESQGRDDQKVHRCNAISVIMQECLPALRRRPSSSKHVLWDSRLRDYEAQF